MILLAAVLAGVLISKYLVFLLTVEGSSMEPTYWEGDIRFAVVQGKVERGDVVVVDSVKPNEHLIKRVVGLPGEKVQIKNSTVYINDKVYTEEYIPYAEYPVGDFAEGIVLGVNEYFVLGDNRPISYDSRYFGAISRADIRGIVVGGRRVGVLEE